MPLLSLLAAIMLSGCGGSPNGSELGSGTPMKTPLAVSSSSAAGVVIQVYQALYGKAPGYTDYTTYLAQASASNQVFANALAANFASTSDKALALLVLNNLGITATTVTQTGAYAALLSAVEEIFAAYGSSARGQIVLNMTTLLAGLSSDVTFGAAATTYSSQVQANTSYSATSTNTSAGVVSVVSGAVVPASSVSDIEPDRLRYSQKSVFRISGVGLDKDITVSVSKCAGLALVDVGTDSEKSVSCTVSATGTLSFEAKDAAGLVLMAKTFTVAEPQVTLVTSLGTMVVEINPTAAPLSAINFLQYVNDGFYANTVFHRVVAGSAFAVAQGGWLAPGGIVQSGVRAAIALESNKGLSNLRGTIGMARTSVFNSATSQFYFNVADNRGFDYLNDANPGYAVFGKIVQGLSVMDAIGTVATSTRYGVADFPATDVVVQSMTQSQ